MVRGHAPYYLQLNLNSLYQNYDNLSCSVPVGFSRKDSNLLRIFPYGFSLKTGDNMMNELTLCHLGQFNEIH